MRERTLRDLFHRIEQVVPDEQELITVSAETPARDALDIMREHNLSQVPIAVGNEVLGVFSYRSFSEGILQLGKQERDPESLPVEVFSEDLLFAHITDELPMLFDQFDAKDAVLVGSAQRVQGIVTTIDALRYFYKVASPYVMLREIELAVRALIASSLDEDELRDCIDRCVKDFYEEKLLPVPEKIADMSFNDYVCIISFKGFWEKFKISFGGSSVVARTKLSKLPTIRNDVFHFRKELSAEEYDSLRDCRDWLLKRIQKLEAGRDVLKNDD